LYTTAADLIKLSDEGTALAPIKDGAYILVNIFGNLYLYESNLKGPLKTLSKNQMAGVNEKSYGIAYAGLGTGGKIFVLPIFNKNTLDSRIQIWSLKKSKIYIMHSIKLEKSRPKSISIRANPPLGGIGVVYLGGDEDDKSLEYFIGMDFSKNYKIVTLSDTVRPGDKIQFKLANGGLYYCYPKSGQFISRTPSYCPSIIKINETLIIRNLSLKKLKIGVI